MKKTPFVVTLLLFWASLAFGQRDGIGSFVATEAHGFDVVNLSSLVPSFNIPLISKSHGISLSLNSSQACFVFQPPHQSSWGVYCNSAGGSFLAGLHFVPNPLLSISSNATSSTASGCTTYTITKLVGLDNLSSYPIPSTTLYNPSTCGATTATVTTLDNTGITATLTAFSTSVSVNPAYSASGMKYTGNGNAITDAFGNNLVSFSGSTMTDVLGAQTTLGGTDITQPTSFGYTDAGGTSRTISLVNGSQTTYQPLSTCGTLNVGASVTPVTSISLPDGTSYGLTWDTNNGGIDGLIKTLTLRTGGTISFTYGTIYSCNGWAYNSLSRVTADGTTTYSLSYSSGITTTTVLDAGKNKLVYTFFGAPDGQNTGTNPTVTKDITRYQNTGTVASPSYTQISYTKYCYNNASCTTAPTSPSIGQLDTYEYVGTGSTATSHRTQTYDSYGNTLTDVNVELTVSPNQTITTTIVYGTWNGSACVAITNANVVDHPCTITTTNGGTQLAKETLTYNSNGAVTADATWVSSTDTLTTNYTRNSNGTAATMTLPNSQVITNTFGSCNSLLLTDSTTTVNSVAIDNKASWNCNAGVVTDTTDPNSNEADYTYDSMNRLATYTDRLENQTSYAYGTPTLDHVKVTNPLSVVSYQYVDGLGRPTNSQVCQTTGCSNLDTFSRSYAWNGTNFETKRYVPCFKTTLNSACTTVAFTADVNPVFGPVSDTDAISGTATWARNSTDFSLTAGPAPSGENTKVIQTEIDGFGRTTSTCALESSGGTTCGQTMGNSGILTSNTYSFDATTGAPKVVTTRGSQTHTTITDSIGRLTSIATPEAGTVTSLYDSASGDNCNASSHTSAGNLLRVTLASGNYRCFLYEGLNRQTDIANNITGGGCQRLRYDSTANGVQSTPSGYPSTGTNLVGRLVEAETDDCTWPPTGSHMITDEWFAYDKMGRMNAMCESTPHSSGYYCTTVTYDADGTPTELQNGAAWNFTWGVDGEDRPNSFSYGATTVVSATAGNGFTYDAASRPTNVPVGTSGDQDTYTYDNMGNMTEYTFSVNSKTDDGKLTWNSIGSLNKLVITDGFNSGGSQTCTYGTSTVEGYDDVGRLLDANCGSLIQHDSWTYDQYDNATRTGNPGTSWSPGYSSTNNEYSTSASYDSDGQLTYDGVNSYSWILPGQLRGTISGNHTVSCGSSGSYCATYDVFGRTVETSNGSTYSEIWYTPLGKVAYMSGQTVGTFYVPAPGGGAFYMTNNTQYFLHPDWLGTKRLSTNLSTRVYQYDTAYTPYGESYDTFGTLVPDFTGLTQDVASGLFTTPTRTLATNASRWPSPDPAHAGWNAYAYVTDPNTQVDPSGLGDCSTDPGACALPPPGMCGNAANPRDCSETAPPDDGGGVGLVYNGPSVDAGYSFAGGFLTAASGPDAFTHMVFGNGGLLLGALNRTSWSKWWQETGCQAGKLCDDAVSPVGDIAGPVDAGGGFILNSKEAAGFLTDQLNKESLLRPNRANINRLYYRPMFNEIARLAEGGEGSELAAQATKSINMMRGVGSPVNDWGLMLQMDIHNSIIESGTPLTNWFNHFQDGRWAIAVSPEAMYEYRISGAYLFRQSPAIPQVPIGQN